MNTTCAPGWAVLQLAYEVLLARVPIGTLDVHD